jgi:hypothetical protein
VTKRVFTALLWGLAGLAVALGLTAGAFALVGGDIAEPGGPPVFAPSPESRESPSVGGDRPTSPSPEPSATSSPSPDGNDDNSGPGGGDDDNSGPGSSGSDDNSGSGSDSSGSGSDNSGSGSGSDHDDD